jgi:hypothetical protein
MRLRSVLRVAPAFSASFLACAFVFVLACAGQGEGQVCSTYNGNNDCANGLVCKPNLPNVNGSRCCPQDPNLSTTVICGTPSIANVADSAAPPISSTDGQAGDESSEASPSEASTDDGAVDEAAVDDGAADGANTPDAAPDAGQDAAAAEASADAASE